MTEEEKLKVKDLAKTILRLVTELQVESQGLSREDAYRAIAMALSCGDYDELNQRILSLSNQLSELTTAIYNKE